MEQYYIAAIKEYNPTVFHILGNENKVIDALNRLLLVTELCTLKYHKKNRITFIPPKKILKIVFLDYQASES